MDYDLEEFNTEGKSILKFLLAFDLTIHNTWFSKRVEHLITYISGVTCSEINFFLIRKSYMKIFLDCEVILERA